MHSPSWAKVKTAWKCEVIVSRKEGEIVGGMLVLIRTLSPGMTIMYSPRGAVLKENSREVFEDLISGVKVLRKKYNAFLFKTDPPILEGDEQKIAYLMLLGFEHTPYKKEYDTIQRRFNYVLNIDNMSEDELLVTFKSKCRYHIRLSQRHGVEFEVCGKEGIEEFIKIHAETGARKHFPVRSAHYCETLIDAFGDKMKVILCRYNKEVVSGMVLSIYGGKASYLFGASSEKYKNVMPNYLMQWEAIKYAKAHGCKVYDFMAVPVDLDEKSSMYGVYRFKSGFSGEVLRYAGEFDLIFNRPKAILFEGMMKLKKVYNRIKR